MPFGTSQIDVPIYPPKPRRWQEGRLEIAQRFNAGAPTAPGQVPKGRLKKDVEGWVQSSNLRLSGLPRTFLSVAGITSSLLILCPASAGAQGGVPLWTNRYDGPANVSDGVTGIAVDSSGNVFVTGVSWSGNTGDYATVADSNAGLRLWTNRYHGPVLVVASPLPLLWTAPATCSSSDFLGMPQVLTSRQSNTLRAFRHLALIFNY